MNFMRFKLVWLRTTSYVKFEKAWAEIGLCHCVCIVELGLKNRSISGDDSPIQPSREPIQPSREFVLEVLLESPLLIWQKKIHDIETDLSLLLDTEKRVIKYHFLSFFLLSLSLSFLSPPTFAATMAREAAWRAGHCSLNKLRWHEAQVGSLTAIKWRANGRQCVESRDADGTTTTMWTHERRKKAP